MLKTSEVSRLRSTSENSDVLNSQDEIYLVFTGKSEFPFYFILFRRFTVNRVTVFRTKIKGLFVTEYLGQLSNSYCDWQFKKEENTPMT